MKRYIWIALLFMTVISCNEVKEQCQPWHLTCEYLVNPLGIDIPHPRFRWKLSDQRQGALQKAYSISVGTDSTDVFNGEGDMWDTGKQMSEGMLVPYQGKPLEPFTKYYWSVKVWDLNGKKGERVSGSQFRNGNDGDGKLERFLDH